MSVARDISDTLSSILPTSGASSDNKPKRFKCRNCGREFELGLDVDTCPHCTSMNLRPLG